MKTLFILRHAKTQPVAPRGDHARRLIERGHHDAETIGNYIRDELGVSDAIVTSDATRARQTAEFVADATGYGDPPTLFTLNDGREQATAWVVDVVHLTAAAATPTP